MQNGSKGMEWVPRLIEHAVYEQLGTLIHLIRWDIDKWISFIVTYEFGAPALIVEWLLGSATTLITWSICSSICCRLFLSFFFLYIIVFLFNMSVLSLMIFSIVLMSSELFCVSALCIVVSIHIRCLISFSPGPIAINWQSVFHAKLAAASLSVTELISVAFKRCGPWFCDNDISPWYARRCC